MPEDLRGMTLNEVHQAVGLDRLKFISPYGLKLMNVEMTIAFEGEEVHRESEPVLESFFCAEALAHVPRKAGTTFVEFSTPVGKASLKYRLSAVHERSGMEPFLQEHPIKRESDFRVAEYIVEHLEFVPRFEAFFREQEALGKAGFAVATIGRIPFQQVMLEFLGEVPLFEALHTCPRRIRRLVDVLDQQRTEVLRRMEEVALPYVEFTDNLDGVMTNPKLYAEYCLQAHQRYADILHAQGKKVGSHTDGNLRSLLRLLAESGLDVCESISPAPLSDYTFDEAWEIWEDGPIIWGGIPSSMLEQATPERDFRDYVERLLHTVGDGAIILGIGDMVMENNLIERVRQIAKEVRSRGAAGQPPTIAGPHSREAPRSYSGEEEDECQAG